MAFSILNFFTSFYGQTGDALIGSGDLTQLVNFTLGIRSGLVALPGGAQAGATPLAYGSNEVGTVATTNDSTQLPLSVAGARVTVNNTGANTCRIYANAAPNVNNAGALDQICANATNTLTANGTAVTLAAGYTLTFICTTIGVWKQTAVAS